MTHALELAMRQRLFALVQAYPGLHLREAARQLGASQALVDYHAGVLAQAGLLRLERQDRYVRLFVARPQGRGAQADPPRADEAAIVATRGRIPLRIVLELLDVAAPMRHKDLAEALGLGKSKLSFHLRKLEAANVVAKTEDGQFDLVDRAATLRMLVANQPTPDLRREFADVWLGLYDP